jgi:predicted DNA-binding transcriptional regulator YafY
MAETTSRILALLNLLQSHRQWAGPELADRLGVTERTLRRDVDRIRELGYRVDAVRGPAGGYRLEAGSQLPPLLLTNDEAVTMAIGLRVAATQGLVDGELTTQTALAKFEQVLPSALRQRVNAISSHLQPQAPRGVPVSQELLGQLALASRDHERIRFHYVAADGAETDRVVEPHALVAAVRNWFLVCWDLQREEWRSFRLDRISRFFGTRLRFTEREIPGGSAADFVAASVSALRLRVTAQVELKLSLARVREQLGQWGESATAIDAETTLWPIEAESAEHLLGALAWIPAGVAYELRADPELLAYLDEAAARITTATTSAIRKQ